MSDSTPNPSESNATPDASAPLTADVGRVARTADDGTLDEVRRRLATITARGSEIARRAEKIQSMSVDLRPSADEAAAPAEAQVSHQDLHQRLAAAEVAFAKAQDELLADRRALEARSVAMDTRETELKQREQALTQREASLTELDQRIASVKASLEARETAISAHEQDLFARESQLATEQTALTELRDALQRDQQAVAEQRQQVAAQRQQIEAQRTALDETRRDVAQRQSELTAEREQGRQHDEGLEQRLADLTAAETNLEDRHRAVSNREAALEIRDSEVTEATRELERRAQQVERRETELAEAEQLARLQKQGIAADRQDLATARDELVREQRALREEQLAFERSRYVVGDDPAFHPHAKPEPKPQPKPITSASTSPAPTARQTAPSETAPPETAPLPSTSKRLNAEVPRSSRPQWAAGLLVAIAILAAAWNFTEPRMRSAVTIEVAPAPANPTLLLDELRTAVAAADPVAGAEVQLRTDGAAQLELSTVGRDTPANARLLRQIAESFRENRAGITAAYQSSETRLADLRARIERLESQIRATHEALDAQRQSLSVLPSDAQRAAQVAEVDRLETHVAELTARQAELEQELARHAAVEARGVLNEEALTEALERNEMYANDAREVAAASKMYQAVVVASVEQLAEPLVEIRDQTLHVAGTMQEQQQLEPPAEIAAELETSLKVINDAEQGLIGLIEGQSDWLARLRALDLPTDAATLVELHSTVLTDLRDGALRVTTAAGELDAGALRLEERPERSTRQMVVAAVLRSEASRLNRLAAELSELQNPLRLEENFELNAQDRKLRNLRARMNRLRDDVQTKLQANADAEALHVHAARLRALRESLAEARRDEQAALAELRAQLDALQTLDAALAERNAITQEATRLARLGQEYSEELATSRSAEEQLAAQLAQPPVRVAEIRSLDPITVGLPLERIYAAGIAVVAGVMVALLFRRSVPVAGSAVPA